MPDAVRAEVQARLGSNVVAAHSQTGGFSPGVAARLQLADGSRAFVKAVSSVPNADSPAMHRREAVVAAALPASAPAPRFRFAYDDREWIVLAFDDVDGRSPELPWRADELERVLAAVHTLALELTPSPIVLDSAVVTLAALFGGWQKIADDASLESALPVATRRRLGDLVALEAEWPAAVQGESLVHLDLRADNILVSGERVYIVDWPAASIGAPWIDLVAMLPSVAMQGGPDPEALWRSHPLREGVDDERVDAFLAAIAGYFAHAAPLPDPPGLPTLRAFQAAQGERANAWLARRRGWADLR